MGCIDSDIQDKYALYQGDCVEVLHQIPDNSVGFSIFSPPFKSLYTFSDDPRDMSNVTSDSEFFAQYDHLAAQLLRVIKPGRLVAVHCMDLTATKNMHGYIGLQDFPGDIIRSMQRAGFIYHSKVTIWKDPVVAMQRTKALGLLYKTLRKDSSRCRQGLADYLIVFRKPGDNDEAIAHSYEQFPVASDINPTGVGWQEYASPCWTGDGETIDDGRLDVADRYADPIWWDIVQGDVLKFRDARDHDDERHICPLQIKVIARALDLWSNPGDVVLTPFLGIGSEAYTALKLGRKAIGIELKQSYYKQAVNNCRSLSGQTLLFGGEE